MLSSASMPTSHVALSVIPLSNSVHVSPRKESISRSLVPSGLPTLPPAASRSMLLPSTSGSWSPAPPLRASTIEPEFGSVFSATSRTDQTVWTLRLPWTSEMKMPSVCSSSTVMSKARRTPRSAPLAVGMMSTSVSSQLSGRPMPPTGRSASMQLGDAIEPNSCRPLAAHIEMFSPATSGPALPASSSASTIIRGAYSRTSLAVEMIAPTRRSPVFSLIVMLPLVRMSTWCSSPGPSGCVSPTISRIPKTWMSVAPGDGFAAATMMFVSETMPGSVRLPLASTARMSYVLSISVPGPAPNAPMSRTGGGGAPSGLKNSVYVWPLPGAEPGHFTRMPAESPLPLVSSTLACRRMSVTSPETTASMMIR